MLLYLVTSALDRMKQRGLHASHDLALKSNLNKKDGDEKLSTSSCPGVLVDIQNIKIKSRPQGHVAP